MLADIADPPVQGAPTVAPIISIHAPYVSEQSRSGPSPSVAAKFRQDSQDKEGKRWARRRDNSRFAGNGHIVKPSSQDFNLNLTHPRATFPKPLPPFLPRHLSAPSASLPSRDPASANAGRYSLSLKGVRKELRRSGPGSEQFVLEIEQELTEWLRTGGVLLAPDSLQHVPSAPGILGRPLGLSRTIIEVHRSPTELIWRIDDDFPRFLLHCVARFHGIVSFSKTTMGAERDTRLTHLMRPNVTRPDFTAPGALDTPPPSDFDALSDFVDTHTEGSDAASELAFGSEESDLPRSHAGFDILPEHGRGRPVHSLDRHHQASFGETVSSVDEEREDDPLSLGVGSRDWGRTPGRQGTQASLSPSPSPLRPVRPSRRRVSHQQVPSENQLGFWKYVFG